MQPHAFLRQSEQVQWLSSPWDDVLCVYSPQAVTGQRCPVGKKTAIAVLSAQCFVLVTVLDKNAH